MIRSSRKRIILNLWTRQRREVYFVLAIHRFESRTKCRHLRLRSPSLRRAGRRGRTGRTCLSAISLIENRTTERAKIFRYLFSRHNSLRRHDVTARDAMGRQQFLRAGLASSYHNGYDNGVDMTNAFTWEWKRCSETVARLMECFTASTNSLTVAVADAGKLDSLQKKNVSSHAANARFANARKPRTRTAR